MKKCNHILRLFALCGVAIALIGCNMQKDTDNKSVSKTSQQTNQPSYVSEELTGGTSIERVTAKKIQTWRQIENDQANKSSVISAVSLTNNNSSIKTKPINAKTDASIFGHAINFPGSKTAIMVYLYKDGKLIEKVFLQPNQLYSSNPYTESGDYVIKITRIDNSKRCEAKAAVTTGAVGW